MQKKYIPEKYIFGGTGVQGMQKTVHRTDTNYHQITFNATCAVAKNCGSTLLNIDSQSKSKWRKIICTHLVYDVTESREMLITSVPEILRTRLLMPSPRKIQS